VRIYDARFYIANEARKAVPSMRRNTVEAVVGEYPGATLRRSRFETDPAQGFSEAGVQRFVWNSYQEEVSADGPRCS
jgi:hypothetical protein